MKRVRNRQSLRDIASLFIAIEHSEVAANVERIDAMFAKSKDSTAQEFVAMLRARNHDLRDSQFIFAVINILIHCINQPNQVQIFTDQVAELSQTYDVGSRLSVNDIEKLRGALAMLKTSKRCWNLDQSSAPLKTFCCPAKV